MFEVENAVATPLEDFNLVVEAFHEAAILGRISTPNLVSEFIRLRG
jgi:hypothetical protein